MVEVEKNNYASRGTAGTALGFGIGGAALGILNTLGAGLLTGRQCDSDNMPVSRYDLAQQQKIAELQSGIALRDANTYTDKKMLELYQYTDGRMRSIEEQLCQQRVINAQTTANLSCMQNEIAALSGMTKTVIPIGNICPEPMQRYNSWTAPTGTATTNEG